MKTTSEFGQLASGAATDEARVFFGALEVIGRTSPQVAEAILAELRDQRSNLKLIASENYSSLAVQFAMANLLTDKYAEGIPGKRYYAGCDVVDRIEALAVEEAKELFGADHAYAQPHSGADANLVAFWAILSARVQDPALDELARRLLPDKARAAGPGGSASVRRQVLEKMQGVAGEKVDWNAVRHLLGNQRLLAMGFQSGGHLTHGQTANVSSRMFDVYRYDVDPKTNVLDYDRIEEAALECKPLILLAGYSSYPRRIDFRRMAEIAAKCGAVLMVDMAHFAGLVAGKVFSGDFDPVLHADVITTTTHKTLRGPRGGLILCKEEFREYVDKGCPMIQGGPLPHVLAAKAVCFKEALQPQFRAYAQRVVDNAAELAARFQEAGLEVVSGGTDNHLVLLRATGLGLTGFQAEAALRSCGITLNRNVVPQDRETPWITSGLRMGTPAVTTLGMGAQEMHAIADMTVTVLRGTRPGRTDSGKPSKKRIELEPGIQDQVRARVREVLEGFVLYPELGRLG